MSASVYVSKSKKEQREKKSAVWVDLFYLDYPIFTVTRQIDWYPSFEGTSRILSKNKKNERTRFSNTHLFLGQLYVFLSLIHPLSPTACLSINLSSSILLPLESDLCQSSVGFPSKVPVSYWFRHPTSEHPSSSLQTSAHVWDLYRGVIHLINLLPIFPLIYSYLVSDSCCT